MPKGNSNRNSKFENFLPLLSLQPNISIRFIYSLPTWFPQADVVDASTFMHKFRFLSRSIFASLGVFSRNRKKHTHIQTRYQTLRVDEVVFQSLKEFEVL